MYRYDEFDAELVNDRAEQFRRQTARRIAGELTEEQFRPLRLMNGLYLQLHAYMLRINVPYGVMSSRQLRKLAQIARDYDKGYGHWTTRQNLQLNWIQLQETPDILKELASVEMHCIQSSGNCIRNTTADEYAGVAADEIEDPRVYAELIRQWSTLHPEFSFLPRKFKIALTGSPNDRAAVKVHDIGLIMHRNAAGEPGFEVIVGGGLGRTPFVGKTIRKFIETRELLSYLEAILRVYNRLGRRDNKYKARIKILVHETGTEEFTRMVEEEYARLAGGALEVPQEEIDRIDAYFAPPDYRELPAASDTLRAKRAENPAFDAWVEQNTHAHKQPGYIIANITVKTPDAPPGDMSSDQMEAVADLSDAFSFGELRVTHRQNLTLTDVEQDRLFELWERLVELDLATANHALIGDIIACRGLDYCALANARSIPVAQEIATRFEDIKRQKDVGPLELNISGCINACGHHHVGNIGILGVDRAGEELYQLQLGGSSREDAALADITGRGFPADKITDAVETVIDTYLELRNDGETFLDTYRRVGLDPFKQKLYDLLRRGEVIEDAFASAVGEERLPADGAVIVDLDQWQAQRDALLSRGAPVGVWLRPDDDPRALSDDLSKLAVVALEFPAFTDGRAYSNARILREQLGYQGELRAVGDVLLEQLHFMDRVGFDVFELRSEDAVQAWQTASADIDVWYQPTGDGRKTALERRWGR